ncbi:MULTISPECIES: Lrp/AsnC family transcriptional regulator [Enterococcus]|uniref:HTH asnC-type domain-containing protein n=1 Tax=Candidatus Enterococcus ferrettii TaxID=2815324 RepID=A0ABV0EJI9_9ENTE|nr:Lrp/AsnC family transcriptional regulator [Enterococcus sp. 665A]MBO1338433.1 Lrp/AsnC family transcriptional regulator [Enterococcus sp. 665A]
MNKEHMKYFDDIDYHIIKLLKDDARMSSSKIANKLGINERTARRRVDRLLETGAMRITAILDPNDFGYTNIVDMYMHVEEEKYEQTLTQFKANSSVAYVAKGWGDDNLIIQSRFKSSEEMNSFLNEFVANLEGVKLSHYVMVPKILSNIDSWMPNEEDFKQTNKLDQK